jgi:hypothetical protein
MRIKTGKRVLTTCLVVVMILSTFTGFTKFDGIGTVYFNSQKQVFDGVTYREQIAWHEPNGMEHAYIIEADLAQSNLTPLVFNGEVRGTYTVGSMINYLEELKREGIFHEVRKKSKIDEYVNKKY